MRHFTTFFAMACAGLALGAGAVDAAPRATDRSIIVVGGRPAVARTTLARPKVSNTLGKRRLGSTVALNPQPLPPKASPGQIINDLQNRCKRNLTTC